MRSKFPLYNLWEGTQCGRDDCIPCSQGAEFVQQCTKKSVVYENICLLCNPGAAGKKELKELNTTIPTAYVGESSRSIKERTKEHWGAYHAKNKESHLLKHQELQHGGAAPPKFIMRVIGSTRTALERQTKEAVRIRRRGGEGAILNSKAEFNRCYIPRLQLEEKDIEQIEKEELQEIEDIGAVLEETTKEWEQAKNDSREQQNKKFSKSLGRSKKSKQIKHPGEEQKEPKLKRRKYELVEPGWGKNQDIILNKKMEQTAAPHPPSSPLNSPAPVEIPSSPDTPQILQPRNPDDSSLQLESFAQGFPPVQLAPSVEQLHAGHLGEVTIRGGTVTSPTPPPSPLPP